MKELTAETEVCLALGYFDSVHLGHRSLLAAARAYADAHGVACAVATFSNNALSYTHQTLTTICSV